MVKDKEKMCEHHNKAAKNLPSFPQNQKVYVQVHPQSNKWTPATVTKTPVASQPRSYSVDAGYIFTVGWSVSECVQGIKIVFVFSFFNRSS